MTNLTEKWRKGELPEGFYYVRCAWSDEVEIRYVHNGVDEWQEIVAEVPDYVEWQQLKKYERIVTSYNMKPIDYDIACETVNKLLDDNKRLKQENTKLKELLKGAREVLKMVDTYSGDYDSINGFLIVEEINQVLGEE